MMPVLEGKRMIIMISPLKAAPKKESKEQRGYPKARSLQMAQKPQLRLKGVKLRR